MLLVPELAGSSRCTTGRSIRMVTHGPTVARPSGLQVGGVRDGIRGLDAAGLVDALLPRRRALSVFTFSPHPCVVLRTYTMRVRWLEVCVTKKQARPPKSTGARKPRAQTAPLQSKIGDFAEDLGRLLGSAERKAAEWLDQRQTVTTQLTAIRDKATALLSQLGRASVDLPLLRQNRRQAGAAKAAPRGRQGGRGPPARSASSLPRPEPGWRQHNRSAGWQNESSPERPSGTAKPTARENGARDLPGA